MSKLFPTSPGFVSCAICGHKAIYLGPHLGESHQLSPLEYLKANPEHPLATPELEEAFKLQFQGTRVALKREDLRVDIAGHRMPINFDVPEDQCLPIPAFYRLPVSGPQSESIRRAARALRSGRSLWASGPPGTGKDAFIHYVCGVTRTPSLCLSVQPNEDIGAWFFGQNFRDGKMVYEEGVLTRALRDGYTTEAGRVVPYLILISDADRATPQQAEAFRLVADSIQGRIQGPKGETYQVLPGTILVMTANSTGSGDEQGQCISSNVIDASLLDRIERFVGFSEMEWDDIECILREEFPGISKDPAGDQVFRAMGEITGALRQAIRENQLAGTFTHRGLKRWIGDCEDLRKHEGRPVSVALLQEGFPAWLDGLPDRSNREVALQVAKPIFEKTGTTRAVEEKKGNLKL